MALSPYTISNKIGEKYSAFIVTTLKHVGGQNSLFCFLWFTALSKRHRVVKGLGLISEQLPIGTSSQFCKNVPLTPTFKVIISKTIQIDLTEKQTVNPLSVDEAL